MKNSMFFCKRAIIATVPGSGSSCGASPPPGRRPSRSGVASALVANAAPRTCIAVSAPSLANASSTFRIAVRQ